MIQPRVCGRASGYIHTIILVSKLDLSTFFGQFLRCIYLFSLKWYQCFWAARRMVHRNSKDLSKLGMMKFTSMESPN